MRVRKSQNIYYPFFFAFNGTGGFRSFTWNPPEKFNGLGKASV
jgi:hypothetical protein